MFKALFGSAAVFVILVFAVVAPAGLLKAQEVGQTPVAADLAAAELASNDDELSDEEIRQLLSKESIDRWTDRKKSRGIRSKKECSDYNDGQGPLKPRRVFCKPADVPAEQIELYRESQRQQKSTFVNEPQIKF